MKYVGVSIGLAAMWYVLANYAHGYYGWGIAATILVFWGI